MIWTRLTRLSSSTLSSTICPKGNGNKTTIIYAIRKIDEMIVKVMFYITVHKDSSNALSVSASALLTKSSASPMWQPVYTANVAPLPRTRPPTICSWFQVCRVLAERNARQALVGDPLTLFTFNFVGIRHWYVDWTLIEFKFNPFGQLIQNLVCGDVILTALGLAWFNSISGFASHASTWWWHTSMDQCHAYTCIMSHDSIDW